MNKLQKGSTVTFYHNGKTETGIIWGLRQSNAIVHMNKRFIRVKASDVRILL